MNPVEDEAVVTAALLELGLGHYSVVDVSGELPALKRREGLSSWRVRAEGTWYASLDSVPPKLASARRLQPSMFAPPADVLGPVHLERCLRVLPHMQVCPHILSSLPLQPHSVTLACCRRAGHWRLFHCRHRAHRHCEDPARADRGH